MVASRRSARHAHLRHGDEMAFEHRIVHLAARQHVGDRVTDQFANAQRALRGAGRAFAIGDVVGHDVVPMLHVRHARTCAGHPRLPSRRGIGVDARDKPGHDGMRVATSVALPEIWTQSERCTVSTR